MDTRQKEKFVP